MKLSCTFNKLNSQQFIDLEAQEDSDEDFDEVAQGGVGSEDEAEQLEPDTSSCDYFSFCSI